MNSFTTNQQKQKANQNIQVYVRLRPLNVREIGIKSNEIVEVVMNREIIARHSQDSKTTKKFTFDRAFGQTSTQREVYEFVVAPLIEEVLSGYNCTVFAYGQTGTGKTHTMIGTECPELKSSWEDNSMVGIIPRALSHLLDELRMMEVEFTMRVSYLELYNEELCDLLSNDETIKIRIFDDSTKKGSVIIQGLEEVIVNSIDDVYKLLEKGKERSKTATTLMNAQSSRSHTVFSIVIHIKENGIDGEEMLKIGKLNLVDLAGSENISKSGNEKGIRTRETVNINQSLLTLGRVITALVERTPHIPYRESKLTRLLQESLGGRTKTSIIATISPGHKDIEETLSTLDYAHRAKNIQNRPEINQKLTKKTVLKEYTETIDRLKRDLMVARDKNGIYLSEETYNELNIKQESQSRELNEKILFIKALKEEMLNKEKIFNEVSLNLVETSEQLKKTEFSLNKTTTNLIFTKNELVTTKRRYKEKKIIINNHVETEAKLTNQAHEILSVADKATEEHVKLQETLDRRKDVDQNIQNVCSQFQDKMKATFNIMVDDINDLHKANTGLYNIIKDDYKVNLDANQQAASNVIDQINVIAKTNHDSLNDFNSRLDKYEAEFNDLNENQRKTLQTMFDELKLKEETKRNTLERDLKDIQSIINEQNAAQAITYSNHMNGLKKANEIILTFCNSTENQITQITDQLASNLNQAIVSLNLNIEEQHKSYADNKNTIVEIENLIEKLKLSNENNHKITNELVNIPANISKAKNDCLAQMSDVKNMQQFKTESNSNLEILSNVAEAANNEFNVKFVKFNEKIDASTSELHTAYKDLIESADNIENASSECQEKSNNLLQSYRNDATVKTQALIDISTKSCNSMQANINAELQRIKTITTQLNAYNVSLNNNINDYSARNHGNLQKCQNHLNNFYSYDLKTYTPTGETPGRKNFTYPRVLAATSPHETIIKRFRRDNNYPDLRNTITEDSDETTQDISQDFIPINSTPIRKLNNEKCLQLTNPSINENILKFTKNDQIRLSEIQNINSDSVEIIDLIDEENKENML